MQLGGDCSAGVRLFYLTGRGRPAVLPVGEERAVVGLGVGVLVRARRCQEVDVVGQHGGSSVRLRDVGEAARDEGLGRSQRAEDVQGVASGLKT